MKRLLFAILLVTLAFNMEAQDSLIRKWKFSILSEAISIPSYLVVKLPIHPGISIGVNLKTKTIAHHSHVFDANFGYFYHPLMGNSFLFWPEYKYEYLFFEKLSIDGSCGLGYKHNIADRQTYKYENDTFKKVTDWGSPQAFMSVGFGLGYQINPIVKIYTDYRTMVAYPFGKQIPVGLHTLFNVGFQYSFKNK